MTATALTLASADGMVTHPAERQLYTATLLLEREADRVLVFHACHASSWVEVIDGLGARIPTSHLALVNVRDGIDLDDPIVKRLLPSAVAVLLATHGDCCPLRRSLGTGGVLHVVEHIQTERQPVAGY